MNQEARELKTFLDALAADPTNAETRTIFADWLEEHGEEELAREQRAWDRLAYEADQAVAREKLKEALMEEIQAEIDAASEYRCAC